MKALNKTGLKLASTAGILLLASCNSYHPRFISRKAPDQSIFNSRGSQIPTAGNSSKRVQINHYNTVPTPSRRQTHNVTPHITIDDDINIDGDIIEEPFEPEIPLVTPQLKALTYSVKKGDSLWSVAHRHGISHQDLARVNNLPANSGLKIGQKLILPHSARFIVERDVISPQRHVISPQRHVTNPQINNESQKYKVKSGDSISMIAWKFKTSQVALKQTNGLKSDIIRIGQVLTIPNNNSERALVSQINARQNTGDLEKTIVTEKLKGGSYKVKKGDNPSVIAHRHGVRTSALLQVNGLNPKSVLQIGQKLTIPNGNTVIANNSQGSSLKAPDDNKIPSNPTEPGSLDNSSDKIENPSNMWENYRKTEALIVANDTLDSLASDYNSTTELIKKANPDIQSDDDLKTGVIIMIPRKK